MEAIQARTQFGVGRQAVRIIDAALGNEATNLALRASRDIMEFTCRNTAALDAYLLRFCPLRAQMGSGAHRLSESMAFHLLRTQTAHMKSVKAVFCAAHVHHTTVSG